MKNMEKTLYFYAKVLILISVFNTALGMIGNEYNPLLRIVPSPKWLRYFYYGIGIIALWVAMKRQTYLPFLGECVLPHSVLKSGSNVASSEKLIELTIEAVDASKVVWWAAKPSNEVNDVYKAYDDYMNSGVVDVVNGEAKIAFLCPQRYTVPTPMKMKELKKHIHYREVNSSGMLGEIKTIYVDCL